MFTSEQIRQYKQGPADRTGLTESQRKFVAARLMEEYPALASLVAFKTEDVARGRTPGAEDHAAEIAVPGGGVFGVKGVVFARHLLNVVGGDSFPRDLSGLPDGGVPKRGYPSMEGHSNALRLPDKVKQYVEGAGSVRGAVRLLDDQICHLQAGKGNQGAVKEREGLRQALFQYAEGLKNEAHFQLRGEAIQTAEYERLRSEVDPDGLIEKAETLYAEYGEINGRYRTASAVKRPRKAEKALAEQLRGESSRKYAGLVALLEQVNPMRDRLEQFVQDYADRNVDDRHRDLVNGAGGPMPFTEG